MAGADELMKAFRRQAEQEIQRAEQAGAFDNLPGAGKPLPDIDAPYDPMWWVKKFVKRQRLESMRPEYKLRLEVERTLERLATMPSEARVRSALGQLNARIRRMNATVGTQTLAAIDVEKRVARWREGRGEAARP